MGLALVKDLLKEVLSVCHRTPRIGGRPPGFDRGVFGMIRDTARLDKRSFDVLVIGGGIYGAWTAYDAALRGLETAVVEKNDWAAGTSSASSKLIHGGLRYLEQFRFGLVKKSLDERKRLAALAPHRVTPLRFLIPVYKGDRVGRARLKAGLVLYDLLAGRDRAVGPHEFLSRGEVLSRCTALAKDGLTGGITYGDCVTDDARFTLEIIDGACAAGVVAANYMEAKRLLIEDGRVVGASATDRLDNTSIEIRANVVVDAAGAWAGRVAGESAPVPVTRLTKGVHLVMPQLLDDGAMLVLTRRDSRVFFVIPWYGRTLLGTTDTDYGGDPGEVRVESDDVDYLLEEANRVLPSQGWDRSAILGSFAGLRALRDGSRAEVDSAGRTQPREAPHQVSREWSLESPRSGLLVSTGGKFTSARADASEIVSRAMTMLDKPVMERPPTETLPFPWGPPGSYDRWYTSQLNEGISLGLDSETVAVTVRRYGSTVDKLYDILRQHPELAKRVDPDLPFSQAEIVHAARFEMALTLEDILRRRIPLLILNPPAKKTLKQAAELAAPILGWTPQRCGEEIGSIMQKYRRDAL